MQLKTILLSILGFVFLILGAIGLLLPLWPTTPFILVSVACFSSSPHIKARILKIPFFNKHIENYEERTGLPQKTVRISLIWLWGMLLISMIIIRKLWIIALLILIGVSVTLHIRSIAKAKGKKKTEAEVLDPPLDLEGAMYHYDPKDDPTEDCFRAGGNLWRVLTEDKKQMLIENTVADLAPVTVNIKYRHAVHCYLVDPEYGERFTKAAGLDFAKVQELSKLDNNKLNQVTLSSSV